MSNKYESFPCYQGQVIRCVDDMMIMVNDGSTYTCITKQEAINFFDLAEKKPVDRVEMTRDMTGYIAIMEPINDKDFESVQDEFLSYIGYKEEIKCDECNETCETGDGLIVDGEWKLCRNCYYDLEP